MAFHVYYSNSGLLRVSWESVIDTASVHRHFDLLKRNANYARRLKVITSSDVEELAFPLTQENMLLLRSWRDDALQDYESITTAFYGIKPVPAAYISYFSGFFDSPKSIMRQFSAEAAAIKWLMNGTKSNGMLGKS